MNSGNIIGINITEKRTDICRFDPDANEPASVIAAFGGGREEFPTTLAYQPERGIWKHGYEAESLIEKGEAIAVPAFFRKCMRREEFRENGRDHSAAEILANYIALSLSSAGIEDPSAQIRSLAVSMPRTGRDIAETAGEAFAILGLLDGRAFLMDHAESFFYHTFRSSAIFKKEAALYHFEDDTSVNYISIGSNGTMIPYTVSVHETAAAELPKEAAKKDSEFARFVEQTLAFSECSAVFLVGPGFERSWAKESLKVLCRGARKVYYSSNLFSRGACYAAMDKCGLLRNNDIRFIGEDLVTDNIGMDVISEGERVFVRIIGAGTHWYEAENEIEFLLDNEQQIELKAVSIKDGSIRKIRMQLEGLPKRPPKTTRINLKIRYEDAKTCILSAHDLGFGELFPASNKVWEEVLIVKE